MRSVLENRLVAYAHYAIQFASIPSPIMRPVVAESLNRHLVTTSAWSKPWCMKMNPNKTKCMTVSSSRTASPPHLDLFFDTIPLTLSDSPMILDSKFTFDQHLHSSFFFSCTGGGLYLVDFLSVILVFIHIHFYSVMPGTCHK